LHLVGANSGGKSARRIVNVGNERARVAPEGRYLQGILPHRRTGPTRNALVLGQEYYRGHALIELSIEHCARIIFVPSFK
jgi:hypothetical protein